MSDTCPCLSDWCELCARESAEALLKAQARVMDITYDAMNRIVEEEDEGF